MKRTSFLMLAVALFWSSVATATEGMWLPLLVKRLNYADMQKKGLQLTAEEIYSVNNSSLKDAIVSLGGFCTAEVVSKQGLLFTNHHCAYEAIQTHSSVEHDYLSDGFWAYSKDQELPNDGLTASFLVRMEDVTNAIMAEVTADMDEATRAAKIREITKGLTDKATEGTHYKAYVRDFFEGNEYYLFVVETYEDVRLVGAPPSSIGKFGGDTDNWMWPRHTGDFAVLRVYSGADGKPAKYSAENVPLKPKHSLPVSIAGVKKDDFSMVFGYPGSTDRFLSSFGVKQELDYHQPTVVSIRDKKLAIMREYMDADPATRIAYSSKYAQIANYWKYFIGQQEQLKNNNVLDKKIALEKAFQTWVNADAKRKEKYGEALTLLANGYEESNKTIIRNTHIIESGLTGADAVLFAMRSARTLEPLVKDPLLLAAAKDKLMKSVEEHFTDYNAELDKALFTAMIEMFHKEVPKDQQPAFFANVIEKKFKNNYAKFADVVFKKSIFTDKGRMETFIAKPDEKVLSNDLLGQMALDMLNVYIQSNSEGTYAASLQKGKRLFVAGLREMLSNKKFYPDANSTLRLTYGSVLPYDGADAVKFHYTTHLFGKMDKEDADNPEFIVPEKLKELYKAKDYGQYGNADGTLTVNFLTDNDITGGNSGSPVINGKGELIGIAFDGNWEAMSGDINFEPEVQRTICVDARYVLFIIDKFAGAKNLIQELDIVKQPIASINAEDAIEHKAKLENLK